jgi:hypothetical protein
MVAITDEGQGFNYQDYLRDTSKKGLTLLRKGVDTLEYNEKGNQVFLVKNLKPSAEEKAEMPLPKQKKYMALRYGKRAMIGRYFPIEIIISSDSLKIFPDRIPLRPNESSAPILWTVILLCPGCLYTPYFQEMDINHTPNKVEFWITPLVVSEIENAHIKLIQEGNVVQTIAIPFTVVSNRLCKLLLRLAFIVPLTAILLDIPNIPVKPDIPAIVFNITLLIKALGGLSICGIFTGLIFLALGAILYFHGFGYNTKPEIIQTTIEY